MEKFGHILVGKIFFWSFIMEKENNFPDLFFLHTPS